MEGRGRGDRGRGWDWGRERGKEWVFGGRIGGRGESEGIKSLEVMEEDDINCEDGAELGMRN